MQRNTLIGSGLVLLAAAGYALLPIFAKFAYRDTVGALDVLTWRFIIAAAIVWMAYPLWKKYAALNTLSRGDLLMLLGMGAMFAAVALMAFLALERVPASLYTLVFYTYPAMVAILSMLLGERLPLLAWVAIIMALVGCAMTALSAQQALVITNWLDIGYPLMNAASYTVYLVLIEKRTTHVSGVAAAMLGITGSLLLLLIASLAFGLRVPATSGGWLAISGIAVFSTLFTIMAMFMGIARIGASRAAVLSTFEPLLTVALAAWLLGEKLTGGQLVGGLLIIASVVILNWPRRAGVTNG
jgi:drug/metabolite transporter (DMT)-like permease